MNKSLATLTRKDLGAAQKRERSDFAVCPAGKHTAKVVSFTEEENYNYVTLEIEKKSYNFFYNYTLKDSDVLDSDVLNWLLSLATIPVTDETHLIEITNSAIGHSYEVETYVYTPKNGKNAGKPQHGIQFSTLPVLKVVEVETEDIELPF